MAEGRAARWSFALACCEEAAGIDQFAGFTLKVGAPRQKARHVCASRARRSGIAIEAREVGEQTVVESEVNGRADAILGACVATRRDRGPHVRLVVHVAQPLLTWVSLPLVNVHERSTRQRV